MAEPVPVTGDCFEAAGRYLLDHPVPQLTLVHGIVTGTHGRVAGARYWHAWIEHTTTVDLSLLSPGHPPTVVRQCIDVTNGRDVVVPAAVYYGIGHIDDDEVHRYTLAGAAAQIDRTGHWGPWAPTPPGVL